MKIFSLTLTRAMLWTAFALATTPALATVHVDQTNVLTHARVGDLAVNTYTELVLRPGETLATHVRVSDGVGGTVTLAAFTAGLSGNSGWSGLTSGVNATGDFAFSPTTADAGSNFVVRLHVTSTGGANVTNTFTVYVPTADEQQMAITEILANPATNPAAADFDPLQRFAGYNAGLSTNDQYVEIANQSGATWTGRFTLDTGAAASPVFNSLDTGAALWPGNSLVIYGGDGTPAQPPYLQSPVAASRGLFLPVTGSGVLVFRNADGHIVDRVVYAASDLVTNGSLKRFPTINDAFVPQAYVGFTPVAPGYQYDGAAWSSPSQIPTGVTNATVTVVNKQAVLTFPVSDSTQAYTLWSASSLADKFKPIFGQPLTGSSASFSITNLPNLNFFYLSTQTNNASAPPAG